MAELDIVCVGDRAPPDHPDADHAGADHAGAGYCTGDRGSDWGHHGSTIRSSAADHRAADGARGATWTDSRPDVDPELR